MGLKLTGPLPGETTVLHFSHLLEKHHLGQGLLEEINAHLESQGLKLREGTIVDAAIIEAPSSTKNRNKERDPEMQQTKKGSQWHCGMKAHIGVDSETGIVHSLSFSVGASGLQPRSRASARVEMSGKSRARPNTAGITGLVLVPCVASGPNIAHVEIKFVVPEPRWNSWVRHPHTIGVLRQDQGDRRLPPRATRALSAQLDARGPALGDCDRERRGVP